jgi:DNA mismatch repair protein MutS2
MYEKMLHTLEFDKIQERLADYTAFGPSSEMVRALKPTNDLETARRWLAETSEARQLLDTRPDTTIGGARDVRDLAEAAERNVVLTPSDMLDIKATLVSARSLSRLLDRMAEAYPHLSEIAALIPPPMGLVDAITQTISDRGEVQDSASKKLGVIRKEIHIAHDRLLTRMQRMLSNPKVAPYLQESLVTQRDGRYVIPLRADAKGRVKAIVHDQSSSGATLFVEPFQVVDLNNTWRELQLEERDEVRRILAELSKRIGEYAFEIAQSVEILAELDLVFARAKYAYALDASEPKLHPFKPTGSKHPGVMLRLWQARHPLLEPGEVVPIDVELDPQTYVLVITGPNTGGKTVTLKTVGLLALMAQSGMHIPALPGSEFSLFNTVHADIGDEQSIEQSLSTFSGHITNIIRILDTADREDLVVIDELGAGTDPQEGAALARAILEYLVQSGITTLVATHYPVLKAYAHATPGVVNASVEFDLESLRPTYHLTVGLPGRSNALAIAQRLGLQEPVIEAARGTIDPDDLRAEDLLNEIHRQRDLTRTARREAEEARLEAVSTRSKLAERLEKIEDERLDILEQARSETRTEMESIRREIGKAHRALAFARQPLEVIEQVEQQIEEVEDVIQEPVERRLVPETYPSRPVRLGDRVRVRMLDQDGVVTAMGEEEVEVQVGMLRVRARLSDLELKTAPPEEEHKPEVSTPLKIAFSPQSPGVELPLRGMRVDEAIEALDQHLDAAYLAGLPYIRIVHGKGTGRLRKAVRDALVNHPQVESFEGGRQGEGGEGVTVARLKSD